MTASRRVRRLAAAGALALGLLSSAAGWASWTDLLDRIKRGATSTSAERASRESRRRDNAVAATRGWSKDRAARDTAGRDFAAVDRLDRLEVTEDELERFVTEGRLAP